MQNSVKDSKTVSLQGNTLELSISSKEGNAIQIDEGIYVKDYSEDVAKISTLEQDIKANSEAIEKSITQIEESDEYQTDLYDRYVKQDGKEAADTYSGRPGFSEHQTGFAVDVYNGNESYTDFHITEEFKWMQKHAKEYGFILRFPEGKEHETGYQYESWHYRYVGLEAATYITEKNITLEEYYATVIKKW